MIALKLAYRNLVGAGLRTWLNVIVLSFSFVIIIWHRGLLEGWNRQARVDTIDWEIGGGQYWHPAYDPYDPFTIVDSHGLLTDEMMAKQATGSLAPILLTQASIYPEGRIQSVLLKGIDPDQDILKIPTGLLKTGGDDIPAVIGNRMAMSNKINIGDYVTVRWRDTNGTFDAAEAKIVGTFKCNVPTVDLGQLWIPLERLQSMLQMPGEASIIISKDKLTREDQIDGWVLRDHKFLLAEIEKMIQTKTVGGSIMWIILMGLAMLAIFDTQILSVWRRQKEIGTDIALGMTRGQVIRLFTIEGAMHGLLATIFAAAYGIPLLSIQAVKGFAMPGSADDYGMAIAEKIFPVYSAGLIAMTVIIILITTTIVSYLPAKRISKLNPTDAIKGKLQ